LTPSNHGGHAWHFFAKTPERDISLKIAKATKDRDANAARLATAKATLAACRDAADGPLP